MKINGSLNYNLNVFSDDLPNLILYTLTQNKKMSIIDNTLKPLVPFISIDSGYYHFDYDYRNNCIEKISTDGKERIYYDLKGKFLVKTPSDFVYIRNANVLSNYYLYKSLKGDTILYNRNGVGLLNHENTDTLYGYFINKLSSVPNMSSIVTLYKVKDKAIFIDTGYFYPIGGSGLSNWHLISDSLYSNAYHLQNKFGRLYSKKLALLTEGVFAFDMGPKFVAVSHRGTDIFDYSGKLVLHDTCYPIFDNEYSKNLGAFNYPNKIGAYRRWQAYLYDKMDTLVYTDYVCNWPMNNLNRVKIKNKWYITDKDFKILHELDDTVSTNNTIFFNRFINDLKLHTLPISLKRAKDILKEYDTIIPGTNIYYKPEFFAALKNGKFTLFDSLGNRLAVVDRKIIKSDVKPFPNYNLINGTFIDGDILYCYKHQPVVKFKIDTVKYDYKDFRFSYKHIYFLRHSSNRTLYDIVNTKGEILHENVLVQSHTFTYTIDYSKPFIIHCLDGTSKLLNTYGQVLYQENKSFNLYEDFLTKLWYCAYYTEYPIPKENILFYLNKEYKPVIVK